MARSASSPISPTCAPPYTMPMSRATSPSARAITQSRWAGGPGEEPRKTATRTGSSDHGARRRVTRSRALILRAYRPAMRAVLALAVAAALVVPGTIAVGKPPSPKPGLTDVGRGPGAVRRDHRRLCHLQEQGDEEGQGQHHRLLPLDRLHAGCRGRAPRHGRRAQAQAEEGQDDLPVPARAGQPAGRAVTAWPRLCRLRQQDQGEEGEQQAARPARVRSRWAARRRHRRRASRSRSSPSFRVDLGERRHPEPEHLDAHLRAGQPGGADRSGAAALPVARRLAVPASRRSPATARWQRAWLHDDLQQPPARCGLRGQHHLQPTPDSGRRASPRTRSGSRWASAAAWPRISGTAVVSQRVPLRGGPTT